MENGKCYCTKCGKVSYIGANFCAHCGAKISYDTTQQPQPQQAQMQQTMNENMIRCPDCGNVVYKNSMQCNVCGCPINSEADVEYDVEYDKKGKIKKKYTPLGKAASVLCIIAVIIPLPIILSSCLCITSMIIAIIDLSKPKIDQYKADDICAIGIGIICCMMLYVKYRS